MSRNNVTPSMMTAPHSRFLSQKSVIESLARIRSLINEKKRIDQRDLKKTLDLALMTLNSWFPPKDVIQDLDRLRKNLDEVIPSKKLDQNLLIASWNIRLFSEINPNWKSKISERPRRDLLACHIIAEIISRFDVVALQELRGGATGLKKIMEILGPDWEILLTNINYRKKGSRERIAFIYDTRKVNTSGLACQLVAPEEGVSGETKWQFARLPYAVGFSSGRKSFTLVSPHILYAGESFSPTYNPERMRELETLAKELAMWAKSPYAWDTNIIALGDFNITDKRFFDALTSTGLFIPEKIQTAPKTLFSKYSKNKYQKMYSLIAYFPPGGDVPPLTFAFKNGGSYKFDDVAFASHIHEQDERKQLRLLSLYISDHYPIWAEFSLLD